MEIKKKIQYRIVNVSNQRKDFSMILEYFFQCKFYYIIVGTAMQRLVSLNYFILMQVLKKSFSCVIKNQDSEILLTIYTIRVHSNTVMHKVKVKSEILYASCIIRYIVV